MVEGTGQKEEERRVREETVTSSLVEEDLGEEEDKEDDENTPDDREICEVTDVTEEDFETTEGEVVDLYDKLMEMVGWKVTDK
jgi:hypothetical protein